MKPAPPVMRYLKRSLLIFSLAYPCLRIPAKTQRSEYRPRKLLDLHALV